MVMPLANERVNDMETENYPKRVKERGQAIVILAFAIIGLMASVGLATDAALVYVAQRHSAACTGRGGAGRGQQAA